MSIDKTAGTAAALDEMVAGIMGVKANKAAKLTPVGMEGVPFTPKQNQFSVFESPYTGLDDACRRIREGIAMLEKYVAAIERDAKSINENRSTTPSARTPDALDEAWDTVGEPHEGNPNTPEASLPDYADLQAEAQAHVFGKATPASSGWTCPVHGDTDVQDHTSPKGREFKACHVENCKEFQKR